MTIRVVLADDQSLIRKGFRMIINSDPELEVVGEASTGVEAIEVARQTLPDVLLMDIRMPELNGLEATERIVADESLATVRVLVLTTFEVDEYVFRALRAGASGFIGKGVEPDGLLDAIRIVAAGNSLLSPIATKGLIDRFLAQPDDPRVDMRRLELLTEREREVVALVANGLSNDEIAAQLVVSPLTVKTHVNRSMAKLGVRDRAQLVVTAYQTGLIRLPQ